MLTLVLCVVGLLFWFMKLRLGLIVVKYSAVVVGVVNDFHFAFVVVVGGIKWSVNVVVSESS
jgi:hypothetical protein